MKLIASDRCPNCGRKMASTGLLTKIPFKDSEGTFHMVKTRRGKCKKCGIVDPKIKEV